MVEYPYVFVHLCYHKWGGIDNIRHTTYTLGMIRTQVYIPDDLHRDLMLLAKTEGVNFSQLIREGAEEVKRKRLVRKKSNKWIEFAGAGKTKIKTNAVRDVRSYYKQLAK